MNYPQPPQPPRQPHQPPAPPAMQQPDWPAQFPPGQFATRTEQRVHQLAWAVFWLLMANVASTLAVLTAWTIVGAIVLGLAALGLWIVALVFSIMALSRR